MSDRDRATSDPKGLLFDELEDVWAGMLGIQGSHSHMQPMTHHVDRAEESLWFITSRKTGLAKGFKDRDDVTAHFTMIGKDHDFHACMCGALKIVEDSRKLDELWSIFAEVWFDGGREDADVTLLRLTLHDAQIWATTDSSVVFGLEMAKSLMKPEKQPDVGAMVNVSFNAAA